MNSYHIYEEEYIKSLKEKEYKYIENIKYFNDKYSTELSKDDNYINLVGKNLFNEGFNIFNNIINSISNQKIEITIYLKIIYQI